MQASFKLEGYTTVWDLESGRILYDKHNVITNLGKTRAAQLLGGLNVNAIASMAIGDGGAPVASPSTPDIPHATDTTLDHELTRTTQINPIIVGSNQLKFMALFLTSPPLSFADPGLHAINEVGLFFQDDNQPANPRMFARNCFPSIPFDPSDREGVIVSWTIVIV